MLIKYTGNVWLHMEGKGILRLPARASQSLRLLGVTSSRYGRPTLAEPDREPKDRGLEQIKPEGQLAETENRVILKSTPDSRAGYGEGAEGAEGGGVKAPGLD